MKHLSHCGDLIYYAAWAKMFRYAFDAGLVNWQEDWN